MNNQTTIGRANKTRNKTLKQYTNPKIKEVCELNNLKKIIIESEGVDYSLIHYRDDAGEHHIFYENEEVTKEFLSFLKNNESEKKI